MTFKSFNPPQRILMGPGPSDVSARVLSALARPTVGHLDPLFINMMDEVKTLLQYAFQTKNEFTIALSAPGSAGMEACFVNLVEAGDKVIVCRNGVFGDRMIQNVNRIGAEAVVVNSPWGRAVETHKVKAALHDHPDAKFLAFVHAETSTGAVSDAKALCEMAQEHDCLTIVASCYWSTEKPVISLFSGFEICRIWISCLYFFHANKKAVSLLDGCA